MEGSLITEAGLERVRVELDHLKGARRSELTERIRQAILTEANPAENPAYLNAREDQAMLEGRIARLEERLLDVRVVRPQHPNGLVDIGETVRLRDLEQARPSNSSWSVRWRPTQDWGESQSSRLSAVRFSAGARAKWSPCRLRRGRFDSRSCASKSPASHNRELERCTAGLTHLFRRERNDSRRAEGGCRLRSMATMGSRVACAAERQLLLANDTLAGRRSHPDLRGETPLGHACPRSYRTISRSCSDQRRPTFCSWFIASTR